jgi:hypothetical protein
VRREPGKEWQVKVLHQGSAGWNGISMFISKAIIEKKMGGRLAARNIADGAEFNIEV